MIGTLAICLVLTQKGTPPHYPEGYYRVEAISPTGKSIDANLPAGLQRWMQLKADHTWWIRDAMSGFEGKWSVNGKVLRLLITTGPTGPLVKREAILATQVKPGVFEFQSPFGNKKGKTRMTYDPHFLTRSKSAGQKGPNSTKS